MFLFSCEGVLVAVELTLFKKVVENDVKGNAIDAVLFQLPPLKLIFDHILFSQILL